MQVVTVRILHMPTLFHFPEIRQLPSLGWRFFFSLMDAFGLYKM